MTKIILITNLVSIVFLTGVIWIIQFVQYPFFAQVGPENFPKYHASHTFWITPVVAPAMIIELITSFFLIIYPPENIDSKLIWLGLILTLAVWASTFFLQVPMHEKLAQGFDADAHKFLVNSNWIRTIAWSLHSLLVVYFIWKNLK
ncbi:MAG TPA: hypothetical protein PKY82_13320 [Pyrinomonadaceae bacterium]|nr:hypothetical protein [Pyrinomonadaceae bacterium]